MKTEHYHNTTNLDLFTVEQKKKECISQEEKVLKVFKNAPKLSASEVYNKLNTASPITSIRRAISNLKKQGKLLRLDEFKIGLYGSPEHYYKAN